MTNRVLFRDELLDIFKYGEYEDFERFFDENIKPHYSTDYCDSFDDARAAILTVLWLEEENIGPYKPGNSCCDRCKHSDLSASEYPCNVCKHSYIDLYAPQE